MATYSSTFYQCDSCLDGIVVVTKSVFPSKFGYGMNPIASVNECSICDKKFSVSESQKLPKHETQLDNEY